MPEHAEYVRLHAHLDHVFNSPECWDKCGDPCDWTEVEQLPEGEYVWHFGHKPKRSGPIFVVIHSDGEVS